MLDEKETEDGFAALLTWLGDPFDALEPYDPFSKPISPSSFGPLNISDGFKDRVWENSADDVLAYYEANPELLPLVVFEGETVTPTRRSLEILVRDNWNQAAKRLEVGLLFAGLHLRDTIAEYEEAYESGRLAPGVTPLDVALVSYRYSPTSTNLFAFDGDTSPGDPPISSDLEEWGTFVSATD